MPRSVCGLLLFAIASLLAIAPSVVAATDPPLDLTWNAPAECPDRVYVINEVRSLLSGSKATTVVRATATIVKQPEGLRLTVITSDASGVLSRREIDSPDCKALAGSAAVFLALAIDPNAGAQPSPKPSASPAPPKPSTSPPPIIASSAAPIEAHDPIPAPNPVGPNAPERPRFALWAAPLVSLGAAPAPGAGVALGGGAHIGPAWLALSGSFVPERSHTVDARPGNLNVSTYAFVPHGGVRLGSSRWLELTAGVEVALVTAEFDAIASSTPSRMLRVAPAAGAAAIFPLGAGFFIRLSATGLVPLVRPRYTVTVNSTEQELFRTSAVMGQFALGIEVRL